MARRFVLLDRDGTIIVERNYLGDPAGVALLPNAAAGMHKMRELGLGLAVVTNQSGVARGYFDLDAVGRVHDRMAELLRAEGVAVDAIYICPHAPAEACDCRKPAPGMAKQAAAELGFVLADGFMVGDKEIDVQLGHGVGMPSILVTTGQGDAAVTKAEYVAGDLLDAAGWIAGRL